MKRSLIFKLTISLITHSVFASEVIPKEDKRNSAISQNSVVINIVSATNTEAISPVITAF